MIRAHLVPRGSSKGAAHIARQISYAFRATKLGTTRPSSLVRTRLLSHPHTPPPKLDFKQRCASSVTATASPSHSQPSFQTDDMITDDSAALGIAGRHPPPVFAQTASRATKPSRRREKHSVEQAGGGSVGPCGARARTQSQAAHRAWRASEASEAASSETGRADHASSLGWIPLSGCR